MATIADVARVARKVGETGDTGKVLLLTEGHVFDLRATGWCTRFVRQCHEVAMGLPYISPESHKKGAKYPWKHARGNARKLEKHLRQWRIPGREAQPGDIICLNRWTGSDGHVAIYLGGNEIAENTSSNRGPGTTISRLTAALKLRVTGYYRVLPVLSDWEVYRYSSKPAGGIRGKAIECNLRIENGVARADVRALCEGLGWKVAAVGQTILIRNTDTDQIIGGG